MVATEERLKVLTMVQEGKITAEEAVKLLEALEESDAAAKRKSSQRPPSGQPYSPTPSFIGGKGRMLQVRVTDTDTGKARVNVRLPIGVVKAGVKMGMRFAPEVDGLNLDDLLGQIEDGQTGKIFEVYDDKDGEHVEIFIE